VVVIARREAVGLPPEEAHRMLSRLVQQAGAA
jgi:hypothetical protein